MEKFESFDAVWKSLENDPEYLAEKLGIDFTSELYSLMKKRGLTKKEVAEKLGSSPAYVSKVFNGTCNLTILSMVKLALAVDGDIDIHVTPKEVDYSDWFKVVTKKKANFKKYNDKSLDFVVENLPSIMSYENKVAA